MRYWLSPFAMSASALEGLSWAGIQAWPAANGDPPGSDCLLLYDSPDRLIQAEAKRNGLASARLTPQRLLEEYQRLLAWSEATEAPVLPLSRLQQLDPPLLRLWLKRSRGGIESAQGWPSEPIPIDPLLAAVTLRLMETEPRLLKAYLDLELRAMLQGRNPDLHYLQRLRQASGQGEALLQALLQALQSPAPLPLPGSVLLAGRGAEAAGDQAEPREPRLVALERQLAERERALQEKDKESELILLQLHQVQEELENQFLRARAGEQLVAAQQEQLQRVQGLMARLQNDGSPAVSLPQPFMALEAKPVMAHEASVSARQRRLVATDER